MMNNFFKDSKTGAVYSYDDEQMAAGYVKDGLIKMTGKEVDAHINPKPTKEQLVAEAGFQKQALISEANQKTQLWQTQLMLEIITEEDKASLKEWMLYVQDVQAVDPSLGADVVWPTPPASQAR
ncbi:tail fiber assembly protein [Morganella morganii]